MKVSEKNRSGQRTMTVIKRLPIVTMTAVVLMIVAMTYIVLESGNTFEKIDEKWHSFDNVSQGKVTYLVKFLNALGFGGLVHHGKDYLLLGDQESGKRMDTDLDALSVSLQSYHLLDLSEEEESALIALQKTVRTWQNQLKESMGRPQPTLSNRALDASLWQNDESISANLDQLHWSWGQQATTTGNELYQLTKDGAELIRLGLGIIPIMILNGLLIIWLVYRLKRQIRAYEEEKKALEFSEQKFKDIAANVPGVVFQMVERREGERGYLYVSPRSQDIYGVPPEALRRDWRAFNIHPEDAGPFHDSIRKAFDDQTEWSFEGRFVTGDGDEKWWRGVSRPVVVTDDEIIFNGVIIDISLQKEMEGKLRQLATTDPLTNACNRRQFSDVSVREVQRSQRHLGTQLTVAMVDIDHFKKINDMYGHAAGDEALKRLVETTQTHLRMGDLLARFGGEEFALMLPETGLEAGFKIADRLRQKLGQLVIRIDDVSFSFTVSIGVSAWRPGEATLEPALERADQSLYAAKQGGRNQVRVYSSAVERPELISV